MILSRSGVAMRSLQNLMEAALARPAQQPKPSDAAGRIGAGVGSASEPMRAPKRQFRKVSDWKPTPTPPAQWSLSQKQVKGHVRTLAAAKPSTERRQTAATHLTHHFFGDVNKAGLVDRLHPHIKAVVKRHYGYDPETDTYDRQITDDHVRSAIHHLHAGHTNTDGSVVNDLGHVARQLKKGSTRWTGPNSWRATQRDTASKPHEYGDNDVAAYMARSLDLTLSNKRRKGREARIGRADLGRESERPDNDNTRGLIRGSNRQGEREGDSFVKKLKDRRPSNVGWQGGVEPKSKKRGVSTREKPDEFRRTRAIPHTTPRSAVQPRDTSREDSEGREALRAKAKARLDHHIGQLPAEHQASIRAWIAGVGSGTYKAKGGRGKSGTSIGDIINRDVKSRKERATELVSSFKKRIAGDPALEVLHRRIPGLRSGVTEWHEMPYDLVESFIRFAYGPTNFQSRTLLVLESMGIRY